MCRVAFMIYGYAYNILAFRGVMILPLWLHNVSYKKGHLVKTNMMNASPESSGSTWEYLFNTIAADDPASCLTKSSMVMLSTMLDTPCFYDKWSQVSVSCQC